MLTIKIIKHWQSLIVVALALSLNATEVLPLLAKESGMSIPIKSEFKDQRTSEKYQSQHIYHRNQDHMLGKNENGRGVFIANIKASMKRSLLRKEVRSNTSSSLTIKGGYLTRPTHPSRTLREVNSQKNANTRHTGYRKIATPLQDASHKRSGMFVILSEDNVLEKEIDLYNAEAPNKGTTFGSASFTNANTKRTLTPTTVASRIIKNADASQKNNKMSHKTVQSALTLDPKDSTSVLATETISMKKLSVGKAETTVAYVPLVISTFPARAKSTAEAFTELSYLRGPQFSGITSTNVESVMTDAQQTNLNTQSKDNENMPDRKQSRLFGSENNYVLNNTIRNVVADREADSSAFNSSAFEKFQSRLVVSNTVDGNMKSRDEVKTNERSIMKEYTTDSNRTIVSQIFTRPTIQDKKENQRINESEHEQSRTKDSFKDNDAVKSANTAENEIKYNPSINVPRKEQGSVRESDTLDNKPSLDHLTNSSSSLQKVMLNKSPTEDFTSRKYYAQMQTSGSPVLADVFKFQQSLQEKSDKISVINERKRVTDSLPTSDRINKSDQESKSAKVHDAKTPNLSPSEISSEENVWVAVSPKKAYMPGELLEERSQQQELVKAKVFEDPVNVSTLYSGEAFGDFTNGSVIEKPKLLSNITVGARSGIEENSSQFLVDGVGHNSSIPNRYRDIFLNESNFQQQETDNSYLNPIGKNFATPSAQKRTLNDLRNGPLSEQYIHDYYGRTHLDAPNLRELLASLSSEDDNAKQSALANNRDSFFILDRMQESLQYESLARESSFNNQTPGHLNDYKMTHDNLPSMLRGSDSNIQQNQALTEKDKLENLGEAQSSFDSKMEEADNPNAQVKLKIGETKTMNEDLGKISKGEDDRDNRDANDGKPPISTVFESDAKNTSTQYSSARTSEKYTSIKQNSVTKTPNEVNAKSTAGSPQESKHLPASRKEAAILQLNLPPFFWTTDTTSNVLPVDYFGDATNDQSQHSTKRQHSVKPLPVIMQAALLPMTYRQLGIIPTCMIWAAFFVFLLVIGVAAIIFAQKRRSKKYTRRFVYTMILASRLREESLRTRTNKPPEVQIDLETNICPYVILQKKYLSDDVFQNLRSAIKKVSEYQSMIDVYDKIKKSGDPQKLDTVAALLTDFFRKERDESAEKAKMIKIVAEAQTN